MKFRLTLFVLLCGFLSSTITAPASGSSSCVRVHSKSFCHVREDRTAIKALRKEIVKEAHRSATSPPRVKPIRLLTWNPVKIDKVNRWTRHVWRVYKARPTYVRILNPDDWACLHKYEAGSSWAMTPYSSPPSGGPYWGGLQMNMDFMNTWGPDMIRKHHGELADQWTPYEQMLVAQRAWYHRGYQPWPQTSIMCGLR